LEVEPSTDVILCVSLDSSRPDRPQGIQDQATPLSP
jgi:hypothetical protein